MSMWGEPPSGREHAIETLLDTEPQAARLRAARALEEAVPHAMSQRPNLVTKSALIEQAYALARYEVNTPQQYDDAIAMGVVVTISTRNKTTPSSDEHSSFSRRLHSNNQSFSEVERGRILRHHNKILAAKRGGAAAAAVGAATTKPSTAIFSGETRSGVGGGGVSSITPFPQLVAALRQVYNGEEDATEETILKTLLKSVMGHPSFSKDGGSATSTATYTSPVTATPTTTTTTVSDDSSGNGGEESSSSSPPTAGNTAYALESLIADLCNRSANATKLDSTVLEHGLMIAALSVLTGYEIGAEDDPKTNQQQGKKSSSKTHDTDDPKMAPPLQVGAVLSLLRPEQDVASDDNPWSLDADLISYLGQAAAIYEERIEIQKTRLMNRLEGSGLWRDEKGSGGPTDPAFTTPIAQVTSDPSSDTPAPSMATPQEGATTPNAVNTEVQQEDIDASAAALSAAVLEHIISITANEEVSSLTDERTRDVNDEDAATNPRGTASQMDENSIFDSPEEQGSGFQQLIDIEADEEENDDDSSSSSSSSSNQSDAEPEEEDHVVVENGEDHEDEEVDDEDEDDDMVLRQALALSLVDQARGSQSGSSSDEDEPMGDPAPEDTESAPATPGNATPVSAFESDFAAGKDESPLPPLPPPPRRNPFAPLLGPGTKADDDRDRRDESSFFDPSALPRFGAIPAQFVLVHLIRCVHEMLERRSQSEHRAKSSAMECPQIVLPPGGMGFSLFQPGGSSAKARSQHEDSPNVAVSLQLLVALFLLVESKRNDAIENLKNAVAHQNRTAEGASDSEIGSGGEEGDDPAIAMALTYFDDETSESKDSLEAKGMRRKAAAAAHDAAALLQSIQKRTDAWNQQVKLFSHACLLSMRCLTLFLQQITRNWLSQRHKFSLTECHALLPSATISMVASCLGSLTSTAKMNEFSSVLGGNAAKIELGFSPLLLYQESLMLWGEIVPVLYPSASAHVGMLRSLLADQVSSTHTNHRSFVNMTTLPVVESEVLFHKLQVLCRRLRVCDLLDQIVPRPLCYLPETDNDDKTDMDGQNFALPPGHVSSLIDMLAALFPSCGGLKGDTQNLYLSLCHRLHTRILLWDGLCALSDDDADKCNVTATPMPSGTKIIAMTPTPGLQFDPTRCSDSMTIIPSHDCSTSTQAQHTSTVHQRASKVWGTVLSSASFSPKTGVHQWAVRLDKCERGHVFVGVATAQASVRTYVGGDKYGWGMIGTQALWHDRRKIRGDYGATFRTGAVIIVTLDTDAGTLGFSCWRDTSTGNSLSIDQVVQNTSTRRQFGGTVAEWGVAFEGLPLDSKLYPAVGLYQRDDRVTLLSVETGGSTGGRSETMDLTVGHSYFPRLVESEDEADAAVKMKARISYVRKFNTIMQLDGLRYVKSMLGRIVASIKEGGDDLMVKSVLPSLASALCLASPVIPILSRRFGLALLPGLARAIADIDKMVLTDAEPVFHRGLQSGKWTIRATGSSGSSSDAEEYVVDFSAAVDDGFHLGFEGNGVGTTGKSKNGLVVIIGTTIGSSLNFVEEWTDGSSDGFASSTGDDAASSCVVNARVSLDGRAFEGTYRNVQFGTIGQIAGRLFESPSTEPPIFHLKEAPASSFGTTALQSGVASGEALLCLAHGHLSSTVGESTVDQTRLYLKKPSSSPLTEEAWRSHCVELKNCLVLPTLAESTKSSSSNDLSLLVEHLRGLYFNGSEIDEVADQFSSLFADSSLHNLDFFGSGKGDSAIFASSKFAVVEKLGVESSGNRARMGSLASLCPSEYERARNLIVCCFIHHCGIDAAEMSQDTADTVWNLSLNLLEDGLRRAMSRGGGLSKREKAASCCELYCKISEFLLSFDAPPADRPQVDAVGPDFSRIYATITSTDDITYLNDELQQSSEIALLRLIPLQSLRNLLDPSKDLSLHNTTAVESLATSLPRLLGRGYGNSRRADGDRLLPFLNEGLGPHYLSNIPGAASSLRRSLSSSVHEIYGILGRIIDRGFENRDAGVSTSDSMTLTLVASLVTVLQSNDVNALVDDGNLLALVPRILRQNEASLCPVETSHQKEDLKINLVKDLRTITQNEISRALLRATASLVQVVSFQTWALSSTHTGEVETSATRCCLDILLDELKKLFPRVVDATEDSLADSIDKQRCWQWDTFRGRRQISGSTQPKAEPLRLGSVGVRYLQENGVQVAATPGSPQKVSSRKSPRNIVQAGQGSTLASQGTFLHQYVSHWLHVLVAASKTGRSSTILLEDPRWVEFLFAAVGIDVEMEEVGNGVLAANLQIADKQRIPARYRCRILRLFRGLLEKMEPSASLVEALFALVGSTCGTLTLSADENEGTISREAASLLRSLHSPSNDSWRLCISNFMKTGLESYDKESDEFTGILCFLNGALDSIKKGSYVLLKPAAAVPLSAEQQALSSSKSHSSSGSAMFGVSSTPHHIVGNGTEGVVAGLCRSEASAGIVSNIDVKNGICEVVLLNRSGTATSEDPTSSTQRHGLTVRALRSPMVDVIQTQEIPLIIDSVFLSRTLAPCLLKESLQVLVGSRYGPDGTDAELQTIPVIHSKVTSLCRAVMALKASVSLLSEESTINAVLRQTEARELFSSALRLAYPDNSSFPENTDLLKEARHEYLSALPVHETRLVHVLSLLKRLRFEENVLESTSNIVWKSRLQDTKETDGTSAGCPEASEESKAVPLSESKAAVQSTPPARSLTERTESTSGGRLESAATNRTASQSTASSDNSEEEEEEEESQAATAAAHLREAGIAQMAELGLPRSWSELALRRVGGTNIEAAVHFCLERGGDMERLLAEERERDRMMQRQSPGAASRRRISQSETTNHLLQSLADMGFPRRWCAEALAATGNNVDEALTWILTNGERLSAEDEGMEDGADQDDDDEDDDDEEEEEEEEDDSQDEETAEEQETTADQEPEEFEQDAAKVENVGWSGSIIPLRFISGKSNINAKSLEISGLPSGGFSSVGTKGVMLTSGKWYYEAILETAGCLQIGWADGSFAGHCHADRGDGCGDGPSSWAYDGWRRYRWHSNATEWGCRWAQGDVIGCMVDMDEHVVSFTLNGKGEEVGMGVAFAGLGFRPCGGVYACVSFNRREKLRIILGGEGSAPFKYAPPEGYRGVGEAVLSAVEELNVLISKEAILDEQEQEEADQPKRFLCDFSDGEHGFELMSHSHRYYGSDASVHLGSARMKQSGSPPKSSTSSNSMESILAQCLVRRITVEWDKSNDYPGASADLCDDAEMKTRLVTQMNTGLQNAAAKVCQQAYQESLLLSSLIARKMLLHVMVASEDRFDPALVLQSDDTEQGSALRFWRMIEASASLRPAGWVGEAGSMAIAAEALGLGISSNDASSSRLSNEDRSGFVNLGDIDEGFVLPGGGAVQMLSSVLDPTAEGKSLGNSLAAAAEATLGGNGGQGVLVFLRKSLQATVSKSEAMKNIIIAAIRRSVRQLAVVEYESEDIAPTESTDDDEESKRTANAKEKRDDKEVGSYPDARLALFFTGLQLCETCGDGSHQALFEAWSVGLLSASLPWRMICAFTAAGILNQRPTAFSSVLKIPTLARYFARLRDTVSRRVWAERAATPVASRYVQAMVELLCSVNHAVNVSDQFLFPPDFLSRWNSTEVDAATPLPVPRQTDLSSERDWQVEEGWVSSDLGWELWTGTIQRLAVDWKTPPRSAVRTLMEGGDGPPRCDVGSTVVRGPDWNEEECGNADGKDAYEAEKSKREEEKKRSGTIAGAVAEGNDPSGDDPERKEAAETAGNPDPAMDPATDSDHAMDPACKPDPAASLEDPVAEPVPDDPADESNDEAPKKKKKKIPNPKLPTGTVIAIESWDGIPAMARRVRWNLTGEEGVYRFGGGGRFDLSHVEINQKASRVRKRHPLPESAEQCAARHGFGVEKTSNILIRLRQRTSKEEDENGQIIFHREGIMEYPEFGAGILIDCAIQPDGSVHLLERGLLFGSKDSGWEARFGQPSYVSGTKVVLKTTADSSPAQSEIDTNSPYDSLFEELSGSCSHAVRDLRNREDGGRLCLTSTFRITRGRHTPEGSRNGLPKHLAEAPTPLAIQFDKSYHASSLSVSRDGRTLSCVSSDGRGTAFANFGFSKGVHYWEVKLEACDIGSVFVGVAEKPSGSSSGSSYTYDSPPRLNRWHGFGFVNFRATYTSGAERIYGAHCHAGDTIGVLLDCDGGRLSFFYDGMKYGEHILNDLGVAFENLSPFGFNCDGCGSGGAGQGAPSAEGGSRSTRYPSQGSVKPRTLWPVVGLRNHGDRVSFSSKVSSSYGVDGEVTIRNILAVDEVLRSYSSDDPKFSLPPWFVEEAFAEFRRWSLGSWTTSDTRGSGPYHLTTTTFGSDLHLDSSKLACATACALLGMRQVLLAGERIKLKRSAGRVLELAEEAVVLGSFQGRLYYTIVSQKSEGGSLTEGGGRAWCFDESEVVDCLEHIGSPRGLGVKLPLMDRFTCTSSGGLRIVYEGGAVVRSDLEIFDGSTNLGSIPIDTVIPKRDVLERRVNSSGVVRYRVRFESLEGWISARIRGGKEEPILIPVYSSKEGAATEDPDGEGRESEPQEESTTYATPGLCAVEWLKNYNKARLEQGQPQRKTSIDEMKGVESFKALADQGMMVGCSMAQSDAFLARAISKVCDFCDGGNPLDAPYEQIQSALEFASSVIASDLDSSTPSVDPGVVSNAASLQAKQAAATALSSWKGCKTGGNGLPTVEALMVRLAVLRALNRRIRFSLPWVAVRPCQEGSAILGGVYGHGASIDRAGRSANKILRAQWVQVPSIGSTLRKQSIRGLIFTSIKKELLYSITEVTTTPTPLAHDEYELPREIRTVRINRIRARNVMKNQKASVGSESDGINNSFIAANRKYSVFAQLQNETKSWGGAALRRGFVAKGHGGQKRAFKVKLIGEGCNDYSGPYREAFTDAVAEITKTYTNGTVTVGTLGILDPTPNNVSGIGENRDLFMFSLNGADAAASLPPVLKSLNQEEKMIRSSFSSLIAAREESSREVEEGLVFCGRLAGIAFRHRISLDLPLPLQTVWNAIVEDEAEDDDRLMELDMLACRQRRDGERDDAGRPPLLLWQQRMLNSFVDGLSNVLPVEVFSILTGEELRDMMCGNAEIDVDLLQRVVEYEGYEESDTVLSWFWETLREFTNEERKSFLQFVWARNRLPLKETDFDAPFKIQKDTCSKVASTDEEDAKSPIALPSASTCFFALSLPEYKSKEELKNKLLFAINNVATMETDFQTNTAEISEGYRAT